MPASVNETVAWQLVVNGPATGDPRSAASVRSMGDSLNQRIRYLLMLTEQMFGSIAPVGGLPTPITSYDGTSTWTLAAHGLTTGAPVRFLIGAAGATLPTGLFATQVYYAISVTSNTFQLSLTSGGSALAISASFSGEAYIVSVTDPSIYVPASAPRPAGQLSALLSPIYSIFSSANVWTAAQTFNSTLLVNGTAVLASPPSLLGSPAYTRIQSSWFYNASQATTCFGNGYVTLNAGDVCFLPLDELPDGSTLSAVSMLFTGNGHSLLPTIMPRFTIEALSFATGGVSSLHAAVVDSSGSQPAYDAPHSIGVTGLNIVVNRTANAYYLAFSNEGGSNTTNSNRIFGGASATLLVSAMDAG